MHHHHHVQVALHLPPRSLLGNFYTVVYHPDPIVWWQIRCGKRLFMRRFYTKCINLPRQAQDRHGENSKQERRFSQGRCQAIRKLTTAAAARIQSIYLSIYLSIVYALHHSSICSGTCCNENRVILITCPLCVCVQSSIYYDNNNDNNCVLIINYNI